jgi:cysteine desulfurase / selenocysteine lyase
MHTSLLNIKSIADLHVVRERIVGVHQTVPVLDGGKRTYINFDNAASTPVLQDVLRKVNDFMQWYSSVHRGTGFKSRVATQAYEDARHIVSDFVGGNERDHVVIFGKNTSEAINKLAHRLPLQGDDVVLLSLLEHHSNDLPWRAKCRVEHITTDAEGRLDENDFDRLLEKHKGQVKLVAISGASNVTGHVPDVYRLAVKAHKAGAQILVDCAQLAAHHKVYMGELSDPEHFDYVSISAHKMYAPFGTGALVSRRDTFEQGEPEYRGGGTIDFVTLDSVDWADSPDRDEAGTPNVVGAVALAAAIKSLNRVGMDAIARHEAELTAYALKRLHDIKGIKIYGDTDSRSTANRLGVIPFNLVGMPHFLVAAILSSEWGIGVRNGCFCAHPYVFHLMELPDQELNRMRADILADDRHAMPGMVRVSFGMYNTMAEVDILAEALTQITRGQYQGRYEQDQRTGECRAAGWQPKLSEYFKL